MLSKQHPCRVMNDKSSSLRSRLLIQLREHSDQNQWIKDRLTIYRFWSECSQNLHQKARLEWRALISLSVTRSLFARELQKLRSVLALILTAGWDEADDDGSGGARALHQYSDQNANYQTGHRIRQDRVVLKDIPSHLPCTHYNNEELKQCFHTHHSAFALETTDEEEWKLTQSNSRAIGKSETWAEMPLQHFLLLYIHINEHCQVLYPYLY